MNWFDWLRDNGFAELFDIADSATPPFGQLEWAPGKPDRIAAWKFYTELRTRISTQSLAYRAGDERTALDSVFRLFELSRSVIKEHTGCTHFAGLTVNILNRRVRPFTAKWHQLSVDGRLSSADVKYQFRRELAALQPWLRQFAHLLGLLAGDLPAIAKAEAESRAPQITNIPRLLQPLPFGIAVGVPGTDSVREEINASEAAEIKARRTIYCPAQTEVASDAIGLSISGGGIRSATFALGVIQELARKGVMYQVDFLSTVSGGGYLGAFITSFLNDTSRLISLKPDVANLPFAAERVGETQSVRQLRNHSKYLTEGGVRTFVTIIALVLYGLFASVLLLAPLMLSVVLFVGLLVGDPLNNSADASLLASVTRSMLCLVIVIVLLLPLIQKVQPSLSRFWKTLCIGSASLSLLFLLLFSGIPRFLLATERFGGATNVFLLSLASPLVLGIAGIWLGPKKLAGRIVLDSLAIVGPFVLCTAFLCLFQLFIVPPTHILLLLAIVAFTFAYTTFALDLNDASPHQFYRDRLAHTYLTRSAADGQGVEMRDPQLLSQTNLSAKSPYHLINCAVNVPNCKEPNLRGRNTDFFLFSKHYSGSPISGYEVTTAWEATNPHLDLGTAMAISGAAAAPRMGTLSSARYTFLLAMLNVRLGYWLRRPLRLDANWFQRFQPLCSWYYFFLELSGLMSEKTAYLNLSDGGHIENLGIYELLRRRCKFIIGIDGEADPKRSFGGLLMLTQFAKIDLGVTIEPDLTDLRIDRDGTGRAHFALSRIDYPNDEHGLLLYIKSSLTGNESEFLKKYRADHPDFPHQSTAEVIFSETQFEAYRALGEHIATDLFRNDLVGEWQTGLTVREWFTRLTEHLLYN